MYIVKNTPFNCLVATRSILTTLTVLFSRNLTAALIFITLILSTNPIEAKIFASVSKDYDNWSNLSAKELMKRADEYLTKPFMETSPEIYSPEFSLEQLADILDINRSYLSQTVNELGGCNFRSLLNSYRILEARRRFEDQARYGSQTIEAIGQSVGFLSRRNFGIAFKKETGLSPSVYSRICKEKQKES